MTITLALLLWPVIGIVLFRALPPAAAATATVIGGYLLLPERGGWNLPVLPTLNKSSIPAFTAAVMLLTLGRRADLAKGWLPRDPVVLFCLGILLVGGFGTALTNGDFIGGIYPRRSMGLYDGFNMVLTSLVAVVPFLVARKVVTGEAALLSLLKVMAIAGICYAFLAAYEVRMSPQLNNMVYGFFPHSFLQHIRGGGFRPLVFLNHGIWLATFQAMTCLIAAGLWRAGYRAYGFGALWILIVMTLSKSLGGLVIAVVLLPVMLVLPVRLRLLAAATIAAIVLTYPMLRTAQLVPIQTLVGVFESIDPRRAESFEFRTQSEETLLTRASERPLFGWGGFGRERVYNSETGREAAISDGFWVITIGQGGWARYIGVFGLMGWSIIALALNRRRAPDLAAVAALALAANLIDLIPNGTMTPVTWFMAGGLAGLAERLRAGDATTAAAAGPDAARGRPVLRRTFEQSRNGRTPEPDRKRPEHGYTRGRPERTAR